MKKSQKNIKFKEVKEAEVNTSMNGKIFKILQRTLLRGGDCNLGWSWKKFSLQCPELGLWTIPGETGLGWETQTSRGDRRAKADTHTL